MKNESFELLDSSKSERIERAKKVYRYVSDVSRRLGDVSTEGSPAIADLFNTASEVQRQKLKDNCEKLFFLDPLNYGKKTLELLWRKAYYEPVSAAKRFRETDGKYDDYLFTHIVSGIGHFQHIITRIQSEMNIQLKELDYLTLQNDLDCVSTTKFNEEECQVGRTAIYSCLIYLGDLCRYQTELFNVFEPSIAARYYLQAAQIDMASGMPFNQLGNLFVDKNYNLDSVFYYIHCLSCLVPFEGGLGNLTKIFDKNKQFCDGFVTSETITQAEHIQNTIGNFLLLIETWYLGKDDVHVTETCNTVAQQLKLGLEFAKMPLPDLNDSYNDFMQATEEENVNPSYLNFNIIHNMVQVCLFTIAKMTETDNLKAFACKAFTLALLSQLLQKLLKQLGSLGLKSPALQFTPKFRKVPLVPLEKEKTQNQLLEETSSKKVMTNGNANHVDILPKENGDLRITYEGDLHTKNGSISDIKIKVGSNGDLKTGNKKVTAKRRRRRRVASSGSSDLSDDEIESSEDDTDKSCSNDDISDSSCESEGGNSKSEDSFYDASDNEEELIEKIIEEDISNKIVTQNTDIPKESELKTSNSDSKINNDDTGIDDGHLNSHGLQEFLLGNNILPSIKLLQDWILTEKDLILSCGESGSSLFQCVVDLLNIFSFYFDCTAPESFNEEESNIFNTAKAVAKKFKLEYKIIPLPEDIALRGTNIGKFDKDAAEWQILEKYKPSVYEENIIRILNFIDFGSQIANIVPRIRYNKYLKVYYVKNVIPPRLVVKMNNQKCREWHNSKNQEVIEGESVGLPQRMGRLWLASQVRELERTGQGPEPTLLVLDAAVLNKYLRRIKQLMRATNFVFLIPTVVLQELDNLKCERSSARDAIRWLEAELKSGSRFLKTQRPNQSRPLPLIKYPRKAPPNVHHFIEILEFCNHFTGDEKQIHSGNGDLDHTMHGKTAPLLILLIGNELSNGEDQYKDFSIVGAAQTAGISIEYFVDFYAKWRQTAHKNGKKR